MKMTHREALKLIRTRLFLQALAVEGDARTAVMAHNYQFCGGARGFRPKPQPREDATSRQAHNYGLRRDESGLKRRHVQVEPTRVPFRMKPSPKSWAVARPQAAVPVPVMTRQQRRHAEQKARRIQG